MPRALVALFAVGLLLRLVLAVALPSNGDIAHLGLVAATLRDSPFSVYDRLGGDIWPYGPGYFPILALVDGAHRVLGLAFATAVRLPIIAADLATAWLVQSELARRGLGPRERVLAAATLLLSPLLLVVSGLHAQIDPVATLCAIGAVVCWKRLRPGSRALAAGGLAGLAVAIKTVPGLVILPLLFAARSGRERLALLAAAVAVPLAGLLPYLLRDVAHFTGRLAYHGLPGAGGLSLLVQPDTARIWLSGGGYAPTHLEAILQGRGILVLAAALAFVLVVLWRARPDPAVGAVLLFAAVCAATVDLSPHYLVWLLPFLALAGWWRAAAGLGALITLPVMLIYAPVGGLRDRWPAWVSDWVYTPLMDVLLVALALGTLALGLMLAAPGALRGARVRALDRPEP